MIKVEDFMNYANSFEFGFVKEWKARSIVTIVTVDLPEILSDSDRLVNYLGNCLLMEGFRRTDVKKIADWMIENGQ